MALVEIKKNHKQSDSESEKRKSDSYVKMDDKAKTLLTVKQSKARHLKMPFCGKLTLLH